MMLCVYVWSKSAEDAALSRFSFSLQFNIWWNEINLCIGMHFISWNAIKPKLFSCLDAYCAKLSAILGTK